MAFLTVNKSKARQPSRRTLEFGIYFSIIFVAAIPFGVTGWAKDVVKNRTLLLRGPLARAWAEADRITPLIFSA